MRISTQLRLSFLLNLVLLLYVGFSGLRAVDPNHPDNTHGDGRDELADFSHHFNGHQQSLASNDEGDEDPNDRDEEDERVFNSTPGMPLEGASEICNSGPIGRSLCEEYGHDVVTRGVAYMGTNNRLRRTLSKIRAGKPFTMAVVGGSVSAGQGLPVGDMSEHAKAYMAPNMHRVIFDSLNNAFPAAQGMVEGESGHGQKNAIINEAQRARGSDYFAFCHPLHVPKDVDIVIVELSINDNPTPSANKFYEGMMRGLLELDNQPAVISIHSFALMFEYIARGGAYHLSTNNYYDIPSLSAQNALLPVIFENGTVVSEVFGKMAHDKPSDPITLANVDKRHLGAKGHQFCGDLVAAYIEMQMREMDRLEASNPDKSPEELYPIEPIPRMNFWSRFDMDSRVPHIQPSCSTTTSDSHPLVPAEQNGWRPWAWGKKKYLIADEPGATISFDVETSVGEILLYYLVSFEFNLGHLACWVDDDKDTTIKMDAQWNLQMNIGQTKTWDRLTPGKHRLNCELLESTSSNGHEFRIMSVMSM